MSEHKYMTVVALVLAMAYCAGARATIIRKGNVVKVTACNTFGCAAALKNTATGATAVAKYAYSGSKLVIRKR